MMAHAQTLRDTVEMLIHDLYELDVSIQGRFTVQKVQDRTLILERLAALPDWESVSELFYAVRHRPEHVCCLTMNDGGIQHRFIHVRVGRYMPAPTFQEAVA